MSAGEVVYLCSPWRGDTAKHEAYALRAMRDSLARGESPILSHLLYPRVLDDDNKAQRSQGLYSAMRLLVVSHRCVVYVDLGVSEGMRAEMSTAKSLGRPVELRLLDPMTTTDAELVVGVSDGS